MIDTSKPVRFTEDKGCDISRLVEFGKVFWLLFYSSLGTPRICSIDTTTGKVSDTDLFIENMPERVTEFALDYSDSSPGHWKNYIDTTSSSKVIGIIKRVSERQSDGSLKIISYEKLL